MSLRLLLWLEVLIYIEALVNEANNADVRFIFLWVAFNVAYAHEIPDRWQLRERRMQIRFLDRLIASDTEKILYRIVWREFPKSVRRLIGNRYLYQPFWDHHNGTASSPHWEADINHCRSGALRALGWMETKPGARRGSDHVPAGAKRDSYHDVGSCQSLGCHHILSMYRHCAKQYKHSEAQIQNRAYEKEERFLHELDLKSTNKLFRLRLTPHHGRRVAYPLGH